MMMHSPSEDIRYPLGVERPLWQRERTLRALIHEMGGLVPAGTVDLTQVRTVLDVGCGIGTWARTLAEAFPQLQVCGVDRDPATLHVARSLAAQQDLDTRACLEAVNQYLHRSGKPAIVEERRQLGFTALMGSWLRRAGFQQVQHTLSAIDVSADQPMHPHFVAELLDFGERIQTFLIQQEVITSEEWTRLLEQLREDLRDAAFCGLCYVLTVSASKPEQERGPLTEAAPSAKHASAHQDVQHSVEVRQP